MLQHAATRSEHDSHAQTPESSVWKRRETDHERLFCRRNGAATLKHQVELRGDATFFSELLFILVRIFIDFDLHTGLRILVNQVRFDADL